MVAGKHFKNRAVRNYLFTIGSIVLVSAMFSSCATFQGFKRNQVLADGRTTAEARFPIDEKVSLLPYPGRPVVVWGATPEEKVWNGFMSTGLFTERQAAALIGNVIGESLSPTQNEIRRPLPEGGFRMAEFGEGGFGIAQWTNSPGGRFYQPGGGGRRDNFVDAFKAAGFARFHSERYSLPIDRLMEIVTDDELNAKYAFQIAYLLHELQSRRPRGTVCPFGIQEFPEGTSELEVIQQMYDIGLITSFIQFSFLRPAVTIPGHVMHTFELYQTTLNRRTEAAQRVFDRLAESAR